MTAGQRWTCTSQAKHAATKYKTVHKITWYQTWTLGLLWLFLNFVWHFVINVEKSTRSHLSNLNESKVSHLRVVRTSTCNLLAIQSSWSIKVSLHLVCECRSGRGWSLPLHAQAVVYRNTPLDAHARVGRQLRFRCSQMFVEATPSFSSRLPSSPHHSISTSLLQVLLLSSSLFSRAEAAPPSISSPPPLLL